LRHRLPVRDNMMLSFVQAEEGIRDKAT